MTGHSMTLPTLTEREREVLALIAAGHTNPEIAEQLGTALGTVKKQIKGILRKLGATNRWHAVVVADKAGVLR